METRIGQVTDKVLTLVRALPNHRGPSDTVSTPGLVTVYDGPEVNSTDDQIDNTFVVIGWSGTNHDDLETMGRISLRAGPIAAANRPRDETTTIQCLVSSGRGETMKAARDAALAELEAVAALLRSDPSLGLDTSATIGGRRVYAWVTAGDLTEYLAKGYTADIGFTITYTARV